MEHLQFVNRLLNQPDGSIRHKETIIHRIDLFISVFQNPGSVVSSEEQADDLRPLLSTMRQSISEDLELMLAKCLKILLRKVVNRALLGKQGVSAIVKALSRHCENYSASTAEIGNLVLNTCYNGDNVQLFLDEGGLPFLTRLLSVRDKLVQGSILGALQGICYVPCGRHLLRQDRESVFTISALLSSEDVIVRARSSGTIHNISADVFSILPLRESGCIPLLIRLLRDPSVEVCQASAGTLQNLSREVRSRELILEGGAIGPLLDLLFGSDVQCQVVAVGALYNLLSPAHETDLPALKKLLSQGVLLGALHSCIFESHEGDRTTLLPEDPSLAVAPAVLSSSDQIQVQTASTLARRRSSLEKKLFNIRPP